MGISLNRLATANKTIGEVLLTIQQKGTLLGSGKNGIRVYRDAESGLIAAFDKDKNRIRKIVLPNLYKDGFYAQDFVKNKEYTAWHENGVYSIQEKDLIKNKIKELVLCVKDKIVQFASKKDGDKDMMVGKSFRHPWSNSPRETDNLGFQVNFNTASGYKNGLKTFMNS